MKRISAAVLALFLVLCLGACDAAQNVVNNVASAIQGDVTGEVGKLYSTKWFDFSVNTLTIADTYKGVDADEGYTFLVAEVYELNDWEGDGDIPMSPYDYYALADDDSTEIWPESAWDEAMMPDSFYLEPEEEATYDVVFMVPESAATVKFVYVEMDENGDTYATFTIEHTL